MRHVQNKHRGKFLRVMEQIAFVIDLNYILAESRQEDYTIYLDSGHLTNDRIKWLDKRLFLSPSYDISYSSMLDYLASNEDKIIKIASIDRRYPNNEIKTKVIYFPRSMNPTIIKKNYTVVDIDF